MVFTSVHWEWYDLMHIIFIKSIEETVTRRLEMLGCGVIGRASDWDCHGRPNTFEAFSINQRQSHITIVSSKSWHKYAILGWMEGGGEGHCRSPSDTPIPLTLFESGSLVTDGRS